mmetsp:Transcript_8009/g.8039  ORF Transcript_8009/g.8039 Transcript_8009/m.8039 type:complete len:115 (-) Transcript_8009:572-916(-)|eukprot:CAMPEP_0119040668 /NCGR_PEP_ID=MMETSP1177-20130426/10683_1 /TAXON_ID=2985 /ORGANISM="Ochromonas sp, Strain CCMP1899" /LENGTH=114 /DNA_ID=CAMNT_0007005965 /DNA_START=34 /DNA_END=378 /DNA_ORIENTATION=-
MSAERSEQEKRRIQGEWNNSMKAIMTTKCWEDFFLNTPCVKHSYLLGFACASLTLAHKMRQNRGTRFNNTLSVALLAFTVTSSTGYYFCDQDVKAKKAVMRRGFEESGIKEEKK